MSTNVVPMATMWAVHRRLLRRRHASRSRSRRRRRRRCLSTPSPLPIYFPLSSMKFQR